VVQWEVIDQVMIIIWFGLTNLLSLVRLYLYQQFVKLPAESLIGDSWYRGYYFARPVPFAQFSAQGRPTRNTKLPS
jgi:hypothetical protein